VNVNAGDVIVADDDGVVIVPLQEAAKVADLAVQRTAREEKLRLRFERKELGLDINNMRPQLEKLGLVYVDSIEEVDQP